MRITLVMLLLMLTSICHAEELTAHQLVEKNWQLYRESVIAITAQPRNTPSTQAPHNATTSTTLPQPVEAPVVQSKEQSPFLPCQVFRGKTKPVRRCL